MPGKGQPRDTVSPSGMLELMDWWEAVEQEQNVVLQAQWTRVGLPPSKRVLVTVRAYKPSLDASAPHIAEARLSWPTATHKHVLGLLWYLVRQVELQLEASDALDGFSPAAATE